MKTVIRISTLACILAVVSSAHADDCVTLAEAKPGAPCVIMQREGQAGAWMTLGRVNDLTLAYALAPDLRAQLTKYEQLSAVQEAEAVYWRASAEDRKRQATEAEQAAVAASKVAEEYATKLAAEEARGSSVWRSPVLWFVVGGAVGAGAVTALALAVR